MANSAIAVSQSDCQSFNSLAAHAAAAVATNLIANLISRFTTDPLIAIVQSVDEGSHDLWVAAAVVVVTQCIDGFRTVLSIAGSLRLVDQFSNFAGVIAAAAAIATAGWSTV